MAPSRPGLAHVERTMMARVVGHLRDNTVAYLALAVALGGTAYAAESLPPRSVGTRQLKDRAVTTAKLAPDTLNFIHRSASAIYVDRFNAHRVGEQVISRGSPRRLRIATLRIRRGSYLLNATADVRFNAGSGSTETDCDLMESRAKHPPRLLDANPGLTLGTGAYDLPRTTFVLDGAIQVRSKTRVSLECVRDPNPPSEIVVSDRSLIAIRVGRLSVRSVASGGR